VSDSGLQGVHYGSYPTYKKSKVSTLYGASGGSYWYLVVFTMANASLEAKMFPSQ
jgi:hypothetical protein